MVIGNKFKARKTEAFGIVFDSAKEARRFGELRLLERAGQIRNLERQVPFSIAINGKHCFNWLADFCYFEGEKRTVEDVKGFRTPVYKLKKKCVEAAYSLTIREV